MALDALYDVGIDVTAQDHASTTLERINRLMEQSERIEGRVANVSRQMGEESKRAEQRTRDLGDSIQETNKRMDSWQKGFIGLAGAAAGYLSVQALLDAAREGERIRDVTVQYDAYVGKVADTTEALQSLREATRGAVTDTDLMAGSALALSVGVAKTEADVMRLARIGSTLGGGAEGFNSLINTLKQGLSSMETLDNVGISASLVRQRMEELKQTMHGISNDDAFRMAVLDVGEAKLNTFGDELSNQISSLDRMEVRLANLGDQLKLGVANVVNAAMDSAEMIAEIGQRGLIGDAIWELMFGAGTSNASQANRARQVASEYYDTFIQALKDTDIDPNALPPDRFVPLFETAIGALKDDPTLVGSVDALMYAIGERAPAQFPGLEADLGTLNAAVMAYVQVSEQAAAIEAERNRLVEQATGMSQEQYFWLEVNERTVASTAQRQIEMNRQAAIELDQRREVARLMNTGAAQSELLTQDRERNTILSESRDLYHGIIEDANALIATNGQMDGITLVSPEDAERVESMASRLDELYTQAEQSGLFNESALGVIEGARDRASELAEKFREGADSVQEMKDNLDKILGRKDGGAAGDVVDDIVQGLRDAGYDPEQIAAMERDMRLMTGEETQASVAYAEDVLPTLIQTAVDQGGEAAGTAVLNYIDGMIAARIAGMTDAQIASTGSAFSGFVMGGPGNPFTVNPGDTPAAIAARTGMTVDQVLAQTGAANPYNMQPGDYNMGGGVMPVSDFQDVQESSADIAAAMADTQADTDLLNQHLETVTARFGESAEHTETIHTLMGELTSHVQEITLRLKADDPQGILTLLSGAATGVALAEVIRASGGSVPGQDARTQRTGGR